MIGIGLNIGNRVMGGGGGAFDVDAQAFFTRVETAGGTLSTTEKNATNQLVLDMKSAGIWSSMKAVYPMVGASAAACAQNLKSSSFTGNFSSGWTFASTGATPNGTSAFFNTNFNLSSNFTNRLQSYSIYTPTSNSAVAVLLGVTDGGTPIQIYNPVGQYNMYGGAYVKASAVSNGFALMVGNTSTVSVYEKGVKLGTFGSSGYTALNYNLYFAARNITGTADFFADRTYSFAQIGNELNDTQASNFYTAVQAFQVSLSRSV
jgi:hypothetical protein